MTDPSANSSTPPSRPISSDLTATTFSGFLWMFGGAGAEAIVRVFVLAVLARLITPEQFGVVAAALTVVALAETFGRVGIAPSVVQVPELRPEYIQSAFTFTVVLGLVVAVVCFLGAPLIASLYAMPELSVFVQVISVIFVIRSLMLISEALLTRRMKFRALAAASFVSYLAGYATVSVTFALLGWGAWALIYGQIAQAILLTMILMVLARHSLKPSIHWASIRQMGRFGSGVTLTQFANYLALNVDYFVIGRFIGAEALGYYSRAYVLLNQVNGVVGKMGDKVLFSAVSSIQDDAVRVSRSFHRAVSLSLLTMTPLAVIMVVAAPEIIWVLLGDQWDVVVLPFQLLISALPFRAAYKFVGTVMRAKGAVFLNAFWQLIYAGFVLIAALLGVQYGIAGVACGITLSIAATFAVGVFFLRKLIPLRLGDLFSILVRTALFCMVLAAALVSARVFLIGDTVHPVLVLLVLGAVYAVLFGLTLMLVPGVFGPHGSWLAETVRRLARSRLPGATVGTTS